jgi:hypothetical protein
LRGAARAGRCGKRKKERLARVYRERKKGGGRGMGKEGQHGHSKGKDARARKKQEGSTKEDG